MNVIPSLLNQMLLHYYNRMQRAEKKYKMNVPFHQKQEIAQKIATSLKEQHISEEKLARLIHVPLSIVEELLSSTHDFTSFDILFEIENELGITLVTLA